MKKNTFSISEFKAKSLSLIDRVSKTGEPLVITKRGKPLARVVPMDVGNVRPVPGKLKDTLIEERDLITPFGAKLWVAAEPGDE